MSESATQAATTSIPIDELLYGFDINDDDTRQFLADIITSGQAPQEELEELQQLSLMRGIEEWDMLFGCAAALRDGGADLASGGGLGGERNLLPFLGEVLGGWAEGSGVGGEEVGRSRGGGTAGAAAPKKRVSRKDISHFWGGDDEPGEVVRGRRRPDGNGLGVRRQGNNRTTPEAPGSQLEGFNGASREILEINVQGPLPASPGPDAQPSAVRNEASGDAATTETNASPTRRVITSASNSGITPQPERAVKATRATRSPFFAPSTPSKDHQPRSASATPSTTIKKPRPPRGTVSSLPIPPLSAPSFGLIQEELASAPFRLLIAVTFLIRTAGKAAIPVFRELMARLPTPEALAAADPAEIIDLIRPLGLSAVRCTAIQRYARVWLERPPRREVRYGVKNYPRLGDGRGVKVGEEFGPEDGDGCGGGDGTAVDAVADARERAVGSAWEVGHLTRGPYALDSWRIFCRDVLLGRSTHWTGWGDDEPGFQPEWMRVLPRDKELRACLRWMWYVLPTWLSGGLS